MNMTNVNKCRALTLHVLLVTAVLLAAIPSRAASSQESYSASNASYTWSAPDSYSGDVFIAMAVDFGTGNDCTVWWNTAWQNPKLGLLKAMMEGDNWATVWMGTDGPVRYQVHSDALGIDTRSEEDGDPFGFAWFSGMGNIYTGVHEFMFAAFGTSAVTTSAGHFAPLSIEIDCDAPFTIQRMAGSTQVTGFDQHTMQGNGVSVFAQVMPGIFGEAAANVQDGVSDTFAHEEVRLAVRQFPTPNVGTVTVEHPDGSDVYPISGVDFLYLGLPVPLKVDHQGGPGTYSAQVNRVGVGAPMDSFWGILGGLTIVDDLDDTLT